MRAGEIVRLRINPRDCLSCIDVVQRAGLITRGMSFAQTVKLALAVLLETARKNEVIPTREGFEFGEMMQQFRDVQARKLQITEMIDRMGSELHVPTMPGPAAVQSIPVARRRLQTKLDELKFKREADPDNWSAEEQALLEDVAFQLVELGKGN